MVIIQQQGWRATPVKATIISMDGLEQHLQDIYNVNTSQEIHLCA